jgi:hypothetical protein
LRRLIALRPAAVAVLVGMVVVPVSAARATPTPGSPNTAGGIGVRLVDVPDARAGPLARSYIEGRLAPGTSIHRRVEVSNTTRSTAIVAVYPAAASLHRGRFAFAAGRSQNELSSWTSVGRAVLRLAPGTTGSETVTVRVPKEASAGQRYAVVWAAISAKPSSAGGMTLVNRVGIRMYLSIGAGGAPPSSFAIGSLTVRRSTTGAPIVSANVRNDGQRTLDISGTLTLSRGPGDLRAGPFSARPYTALVPGTATSVTVVLDRRLPRGPWRVRIHLRSGSVQRVAVATMTFPPDARVTHPATRRPAPARSHWLAIFVVVLLLAAATILVFAVSAARGHARGSANGGGPP